MRIAFVADLHGNRPATEALERDLALTKPDQIICLGDIVGKGPSSLFTFDWAFAHCQLVIGGNWDYGVGFRSFPNDRYYWEQLGPERLRRLRELPRESELWFSGRRFRLFHGRPVMPELYTVADDRELLQSFLVDEKGIPYDGLFYADAHRQAMRTLSPGVLVNTGSVGNAMGVPKCCYALLEGEMGRDPAPLEIRLRQLDYDRKQAVRDAEAAEGLRMKEAYIREIQTGIYSRNL